MTQLEKIIKELEKLKAEYKNYSNNTSMNAGYRVAIMDSIDLIKRLTKEEEVDLISALPTKEEIENKANSYNNSMASIAESTWMPQGFKEGVEWIIKKLTIPNVSQQRELGGYLEELCHKFVFFI